MNLVWLSSHESPPPLQVLFLCFGMFHFVLNFNRRKYSAVVTFDFLTEAE